MRIVTAAVILRDGCVLIARRSEDSKLAGQWEFPGGKLEEGESLRACLERELREELGIDSQVGEHFLSNDYVYGHGGFRIEAFLVTWTGGQVMLNAHDRIEWVAFDDLETYPLLPADIPIARKLRAVGVKVSE